MTAEMILDIVLASIVGVMQLYVYLACLIWRIKKYRKGLHYSAAGIFAVVLLAFAGIFLPVGGFTFLNGGTAGTKTLFFAMVFCPLLAYGSVRWTCFCVYLDGKCAVKRTLFSEKRVDLTAEGAFIDDSDPINIFFWIRIGSAEGEMIEFNCRRIEGNLTLFLNQCKKVIGGFNNEDFCE